MNLKQAFYKDYYQGIDFRKYKIPENTRNLNEAEKRDLGYLKDFVAEIEEKNKKVFKDANDVLFDFSFKEKDFSNLDLNPYNLNGFETIPLSTIYPGLLTGIGMVHETNNKEELKLGFFFDHTSGLPMLPGSGVKGAIRGAFPQFEGQSRNMTIPNLDKTTSKQKAKAEFIAALFTPFENFAGDETELFTKVHQLELSIFEGVNIREKVADPKKDHYLPMSKRCRFFEAIIAQSNAPNNKILGIDALTPHGKNPLKNPIPLPFLKVLPEVVFNFQFIIQSIDIEGVTVNVKGIKDLFKNILLILGVGAKTNVGYGQFTDEIKTNNQGGRSGGSQTGPNTPRWGEVIPKKAIDKLKKDVLIEGIVHRIEGDYVYIHFTANNVTGEIRKKFGKIKDIENNNLAEVTQINQGDVVLIKINREYKYGGGQTLQCQIRLKN